MCGILGGFVNKKLARGFLLKTLSLMGDRGPDGREIWQKNEVFMAMTRLAIVDLKNGQQPFLDSKSQIVSIANGEIYNHKEVKNANIELFANIRSKSDCEVLIPLYKKYGKDLNSKIRGMYAFAVYDAKEKSMLVSRDQFGKKPLFYHCSDRVGFIFSSELKCIKVILNYFNHVVEIEPSQLNNTLSYGSPAIGKTIYKDIFQLKPQHSAIFRNGELKTFKYKPFTNKDSQTSDLSSSAIRKNIEDAVCCRITTEVPLGLLLSGGLDSSIIAYHIKKLGTPIKCFTVRTGNGSFNETNIAKRTAETLGLNLEVVDLRLQPVELITECSIRLSNPLLDPSVLPTYGVFKSINNQLKVVLNGDGADELFLGYRRYNGALISDMLPFCPNILLHLFQKTLKTRKQRSLLGFIERIVRGNNAEETEKFLIYTFNTIAPSLIAEYSHNHIVHAYPQIKLNHKAFLQSLITHDRNVNLPNNLLTKMDICSMAHSIEARSPFMDVNLWDSYSKCSPHKNISFLKGKKLLRSAYRGLLPSEVISGGKKGFEIPLQQWLNNELYELLHDNLNKQSLLNNYFDLIKLLKYLDTPMFRGNKSLTKYCLLYLELWIRANNYSYIRQN